MKFLLDTDTISFAIRGQGRVGEHLLAATPADVAISAITEAELWFGVQKSGSRALRRAVEAILSAIPVLPVSREAAREYGELRVWLEQRGRPIGLADTFIAAHARSLGLTMVTHNTGHFSRVPRLKLADWL